jgi:hypothetical protein
VKVALQQTLLLDAVAQARETEDGYLVAFPRVARTGIQVYRGFEVGKPSMDSVKVFRPEEEVFHKDAMSSAAFRPISMNHPPEMVNADNWREYAAGQVGSDVARDGDFLRLSVILMDGAAIRDVKAGKRELSLGYTAELDWTPGVDPKTGEKYDAVQREIRVNHLAVVDAARGGSKLNLLGDANMKTIVVDGVSLQVEDTAAAVIQRALDAQTAKIADLQKKVDEFPAKEKEQEEKDKKAKDSLDAANGKVAALEAQLKDARDPAKIQAAVRDRAALIAKGKAVLGDKLVVDGKTDAEIRKQVVDAKLGDKAKDLTDVAVVAAFDALTVDVKVEDATSSPGNDPLRNALDGAPSGSVSARDKAYDAYLTGLEDAWKRPASAA